MTMQATGPSRLSLPTIARIACVVLPYLLFAMHLAGEHDEPAPCPTQPLVRPAPAVSLDVASDSAPSLAAPSAPSVASSAASAATVTDCVEHLSWIRAARSRQKQTSHACSVAFEGCIQRELQAVKRRPALRYRRYAVDHGPDYEGIIRCLGAAEDWSTTKQRDPKRWEKRGFSSRSWARITADTTALGGAPKVPEAEVPKTEGALLASFTATDVVAPESHPVLHPLHGGVPPARLVQQSRFLGRLAAVLNRSEALAKDEAGSITELFGVAEIGAGSGGLLYPLCPPHPRVRCYGGDYAKRLVDDGNEVYRFARDAVEISHTCFLPHVPNAAVDAAISHGVVILLTADQACRHIAEALRILKPGGRAVVWMIKRRWQGTRYHWSFFVNASVWPDAGPESSKLDADGAFFWERGVSSFDAEVLPICSAELGELVSRVDVYVDGPKDAAVYNGNRFGFFGIRMTRSAVPWPWDAAGNLVSRGANDTVVDDAATPTGLQQEPTASNGGGGDTAVVAARLRRFRRLVESASRMTGL